MLIDRQKLLNVFKRLENARSKENEMLKKVCIKFLKDKIELVATDGNKIIFDRLDFYHDFVIGTKFCFNMVGILNYLKDSKEKNVDLKISDKLSFNDILFINLESASSYPKYESLFNGCESENIDDIMPSHIKDSMQIGFTKKYLIDLIKNIDAKYIYFEIDKNDNLSAVKIAAYAPDVENVNILMPAKLK